MKHWHHRRSVLLATLLLLLGAAPGRAQEAPPALDVDAVSTRSEGGSPETRVDLYTRIPYSGLRFVSAAGGFSAAYEVTATVHTADRNGRPREVALTRTWPHTAEASTYAATQSDRMYERALESLTLKPGAYVLDVQLRDRNAGQTLSRRLPLVVRDLNRIVAISDLVLLDGYDAQRSSITPRISSRIAAGSNNLSVFYEIFARRAHRVKVTRELVRRPKTSEGRGMLSIFNRGGKQEAEVAFAQVEAAPLRVGRNQVIVDVPIAGLGAGEYVLRVVAEDEQGRLLDRAEMSFTLDWDGLDNHIRDLDQAIAQLSYIAKSKDLKHIETAASEPERLARFRAFWDKRDPTPGTPRNERMEEYYYRINYANRQYGGPRDGWKTDRGHVAILFGAPDYVERRPAAADAKPYEVWFYYRIRRQFIFIDRTGSGDYELKEPIWDERTRIR